MPQMPIQDIDKKTHGDWYVYHVYQVMPGEEVHAHDQNDELESLKSSGWDENETGGKVCQTQSGALRHLQKVIKNQTKNNVCIRPADRSLLYGLYHRFVGMLKKHPNRETETWCVWGRSAHRSPSALHHTAVTTLRFAPVSHMKQNTDMLHVKSIHRDIVILWLKNTWMLISVDSPRAWKVHKTKDVW